MVDHPATSTRRSLLWLGLGAVAGAAVAGGFLLLGWIALTLETTSDPQTPHFVEEAAAAGLDHRYDGDFAFYVGGGVAVLDCDEDGRPDLYLAGGANPSALYRNESTPGGTLQFEPLATTAAVLTDVTGAYPLDVDSDGLVDLAVLRVGENVVLRGTGNCEFERANELWSIDGGDDWTAAFSATWEGDAELPTLAFGNYLDLDEYLDTPQPCADHALLRPAPTDGYAAPATLSPGWCTLSILFSDWNRSGRADLRMTNDRHYYVDGEEQLWNMAADPPAPYTQEEGWEEMQIWGMGIASQDLTGDGLPEVFLTSQGDNKLQTLADGATRPTYRDMARSAGATATRPFVGDDTQLPSTAWHAEFQDVNNDGIVDLFIAKGNVEAQPDYASEDPNNLLLGTGDGAFSEAAAEAGIADFANTRGAALADFNLDGLLDLVEVNRRQPVQLWRNVGFGDATTPEPMGNWVALRLHQTGPNPDAIGAWVEARHGGRVTGREITVGGGHAGGQLGPIHFGIGDAGTAEVRVRWPGGELGPWIAVDANTFVTIERGEDAASVWNPRA
jgi:enediyne biosynthesis protein E4